MADDNTYNEGEVYDEAAIERKKRLTNFVLEALFNYDDIREEGEYYFTFVRISPDTIAINYCEENTELDSFFLTIKPHDKRFRFKCEH